MTYPLGIHGLRGMGRLDRFLIGSVSLGVAARAHCSVEVVRAGNERDARPWLMETLEVESISKLIITRKILLVCGILSSLLYSSGFCPHTKCRHAAGILMLVYRYFDF